MEGLIASLIGIGLFLLLVLAGMHIAFAALVAATVGLTMLVGLGPTVAMLGYITIECVSKYTFGVIPLFILMGYFLFYSGIVDDIYEGVRTWIGHMQGGLAIATTGACALFAACSGVSVAAAAMFSKIAVPEMRKHGYSDRLSAGVVAASGTLAALIPPSALIIVYGILAEQSIGKLLVAGFIPGVASALIYMVMIYVWALRYPSSAPRSPSFPWRERVSSVKTFWPIILIFVLIIGGIYLGIFTPTEAGAIGALIAFFVMLFRRALKWPKLGPALRETVVTTTMIFAIIVCVKFLMHLLAFSKFTILLSTFVSGLAVPRLVVLVVILSIYIVLGCFLGSLGMLMLTVPVFTPVAIALGYNLIWFGIIVIKMCEIALITPPVGANVYVVKTVLPDMRIEEIFKGVIPFLCMDVLTVALLIAFPQITLFLPQMM